ncbi:MAG: ABC transporter ATP-binding protein, partial [Gemmatimonadales bacterium]
MTAPLLVASGLRKDYPMNGDTVHALRGVSLRVDAGEYVAIVGPSGSGKSTLLQLIGGIDTPSSGTVELLGTRLDLLSDRELTRLRLNRLGFVFQRFHLLPVLTARENVELPMAEARSPPAQRRARADELLAYVGLAARGGHRATQLSGGEMQRVAIARA